MAERNWVVTTRRGNHSAFSGYHFTPSDYSAVACNTCGEWGRTKAKYVAQLPDGSYDPAARGRYKGPPAQKSSGSWPPR